MNRITATAFAALLATGLTTGGAAHADFQFPPPDITFEQVEPQIRGTVVYLPMAPTTENDARTAQLSIDLYLRNQMLSPQTLTSVLVEFPGSSTPSVQLDEGLQMRCPWAGSLVDPLVLPPGVSCRVALLPDLRLDLPAGNQVKLSVFFAGQPTPITTTRPLAAHVNSTLLGSYRFPAKASDLPAGQYWSGSSSGAGSHHRMHAVRSMVFAHDMGVVRREGDKWVSYPVPEEGELDPQDENADFLVWGVPIYAMADGIVTGCARTNADNIFGSDEDTWGAPNFVEIQHGDELAWYGHLRQDSIDPAICFAGAVVEEGQRLGEAGNSGSSSSPHLHIQVSRADIGFPLLFNDMFLVERDTNFTNPPFGNAPWSEVDRAGLTWEKSALWPGGLRRRGSIDGVAVSQVTMMSPSARRKVTAVRDGFGNLVLDLWNVTNDGELSNLAKVAVLGGVSKIAPTRPNGTGDLGVAMRTAAGNFKLRAYDVTASSLVFRAERNEGAILDVAAAPAPFASGLVTARRTTLGTLQVTAYETDILAGTISKGGEITTGTAKTVAVAKTQAFTGVVTATTNALDRLQLSTFAVGPGGLTIDLEDQEEFALSIQDVEIAHLGLRSNGHDLVVTAARRTNGTLAVTAWDIDAAGFITRLGTSFAGTASDLSIARASSKHVLTGLSDGSGNYKLIAWHIDADGKVIRRTDTAASAGAATATAVELSAGLLFDDPTFAVTGMRQSDGNLKLINFQVLLTD